MGILANAQLIRLSRWSTCGILRCYEVRWLKNRENQAGLLVSDVPMLQNTTSRQLYFMLGMIDLQVISLTIAFYYS